MPTFKSMATFKRIMAALAAVMIALPMAAAEQGAAKSDKKTAPSVVGDWQGTLQAGTQQLHVVLHITKAADGSLKATLDSVDQGANGIPIDEITFKDGKLSFTSNAIHGKYDGQLSTPTEIKGTWSQGEPLPLNFKRAAQPSKINGA